MARRRAIQQERVRVQLEIENTEDALDKLVSFNYALMQEMEMDSQSDYSTDATGTDTDASSPTASSTLSEHLRSVFPASPLTHNATNGPSSISSSCHEPSSPPSPVSSAPKSYAASSEYDGDAEYLDALKELRNDQFHSNYNAALAAEAHLEALRCEAADLAHQRYLNRAHKYTPRPPGRGLDRQAFNELYEAIKDHAVFKSRGKKPQTSPRIQLAVALWRFGGYGNRASAKGAVQWSGYSIGSVLKFTDRVMVALNEPTFRQQIIRWPNQVEREQSKAWMESQTCPEWRNGWCMVDGTLIYLTRTPKWFGASFTCRKSEAALNIQIVNTPDGRIIDYTTGSAGSVADVTIWRQSRIHKNRETLLVADSGYPLESWVMTPYSRGERDSRENKRFNYYVSRARVRAEHTIGYLKSRFASLQELSISINSQAQFEIANQWVGACIIAHRFATEVDWFVGKFDYCRPEEPPELIVGTGGITEGARPNPDDDQSETQQLNEEMEATRSETAKRRAELRVAKSIRDRRRTEILRHYPLGRR